MTKPIETDPSKAPEKIQVYLGKELAVSLAKAAKENGRTVAAEIRLRLSKSFAGNLETKPAKD